MALGTPVAAATAYNSAAGTTTVAPAYPSGILATDVVLLFVGQKPSTANSGTVTTPSGWTLRDELLAAGGYGTTLGADTGNTNLRVYSWNTPVAGQTGTLSVTLGTNNISWAFMVRIPTGGGAITYGSADGQRTTQPTSPMSIALTNGATATNFQAGDLAIWAMCIPTDVTTPGQFSAQSVTASGATFATAVELNEPDSGTNNDIGGYSAYASVTAGSSTTAPTVTATLTGTLTNVRGPVVLVRVREAAPAPITGTFAATESGSDTFAGAGDVLVEGSLAATESGSDTFAATGTVTAGGISGTMAVTETGSDTFAGAGDVIVKGTLAATETGADTFSASGDVIVRGSMAATESGADTFFATGGLVTLGTMAATESGSDILAAVGKVITNGVMSATEAGSDTLSASGQVIVSGALAATESGQDVMSATGVVTAAGIVGTMSATESGADFTDGYTYPEYVEPPGYYAGWTGTVTNPTPKETGGGGGGVAAKGRKKVRSTYVRNTAKENLYAVLSQLDTDRQAEVVELVAPLAALKQPEAQRIAATVQQRSTELESVRQLHADIARLEQQLKSKRDSEVEYATLRKMSLDLREMIAEEEEFIEAYSHVLAADSMALLSIVGVRV